MKIKATRNGEVKEFELRYSNYSDILNLYTDEEIDSEWDIEMSEIYISNQDEIPNDLSERARFLNTMSNTMVSIDKNSMYQFRISISGKPADTLAIFDMFGVNHVYHRLYTTMSADLNMIGNVTSESHKSFDYNYSLIIRYLSDRNGNVNNRFVYDTLLTYGGSEEVSTLLNTIFKNIYGTSINDAKLPSNGDKMSLNNIDDEKVEELKSKMADDIDGES